MSSMNNNSPPVEMSQRNDSKDCLTITIDQINEAAQKTQSTPSAFIYRVPEELRKLNESAYTPRLVSIGPLHSNAEHLKPNMREIKLSYVDALFRRVTSTEKDRSTLLSKCGEEMRELNAKAREYYAEQVDELNEDMLVIDGCFILEVLYRHYINKKNRTKENSNNDAISGSSARTCVAVQHDLLLLENQLPFFVLEKLFSLTVDRILDQDQDQDWNQDQDRDRKRSSRLSLCECVLSYFTISTSKAKSCEGTNSLGTDRFTNWCISFISTSKAKSCEGTNSLGTDKLTKREKNGQNYDEVKHILHLLHKHYLPLNQTNEKGHVEFMHSASDLEYAGVKFVVRTGNDDAFVVKFTEPKGLFWWFKRAHFEIPNWCIYEYFTEPFLRNLIAFEQCCPDFGSYITSFAFLMDRLINTTKDVKVLEKAGVICNYLGAHEEARDLFNKLCKEVVLGECFYFATTCKQATAYSKRFWPAAMAHLRRDYFATPWTFIAFCAAFIVFGMAVATFVRRLVF